MYYHVSQQFRFRGGGTMIFRLAQVFSDSSAHVRGRMLGIYAVLIGMNVLAWGWALIALRAYPVMLGTAMLAYGFGLRHAVDADHIAAIDNATRKLMQENKRPVALGLFFSLGHSTVIVLASAAIAVAASAMTGRFARWKAIGGLVSTSVSALFLFALAVMNLVILRAIYRSWRQVKAGGAYREDDFDMLMASRGLLARIFRPLFRTVTSSWHMAPLGFLFGLGFDTATEIGLLAISAAQASKGMPALSIMVFPALFSAGMVLVDTLDGHLMLGAYGWAYLKPVRKIYYNMTMTLVSVIVAIVIGLLEVLGLLADTFELQGWFWQGVRALTHSFGILGYFIITIFVLCWLVSALIYRARNFDKLTITRRE
jgi:high-affinity nickel-transport protein